MEKECFEDIEALINNVLQEPQLMKRPDISEKLIKFIDKESTVENAFDLSKSHIIDVCRALVSKCTMPINPDADLHSNLKDLLRMDIVLPVDDKSVFYEKLIVVLYREKLIDTAKIVKLLEENFKDDATKIGIIFEIAKKGVTHGNLFLYAEKLTKSDELRDALIPIEIAYGFFDKLEDKISRINNPSYQFLLYFEKAKKEVELGIDCRQSLSKAKTLLPNLARRDRWDYKYEIDVLERNKGICEKKSVADLIKSLSCFSLGSQGFLLCVDILANPQFYINNPYKKSDIIDAMKKYLETNHTESDTESLCTQAVRELTRVKQFSEALEFAKLAFHKDEYKAMCFGFIGAEMYKYKQDTSEILLLLENIKKRTAKDSYLYATICFSIGVIVSEDRKRIEFDDANETIECHKTKFSLFGICLESSLLREKGEYLRKAGLLDDAKETLEKLTNEKLDILYMNEIEKLAIDYANKGDFKNALEISNDFLSTRRLRLVVDILNIQSSTLHPKDERKADNKKITN